MLETQERGRPAPEAARVITLLMRIVRDEGRIALQEQARSLGLPLSTAYRFVSQLRNVGLVRRCRRGAFGAGLELARLTASLEPRRLMTQIARPHLEQLAKRLRLTVHLGILEEDMVTYLTKCHGGGPRLFTRSGTQLEAYCSAVGKVLLAALPPEELDRYLNTGPMVPLTANTIIKPDRLKKALAVIRINGFAVDAEEVIEDLRCVAVPVCDRRGNIAAAVSVSRMLDSDRSDETQILVSLRECASDIGAEL